MTVTRTGVQAKTISKELGLYSGNTNLLRSCYRYQVREYDAYEDPAMAIIKDLWKKVKNTQPPSGQKTTVRRLSIVSVTILTLLTVWHLLFCRDLYDDFVDPT